MRTSQRANRLVHVSSRNMAGRAYAAAMPEAKGPARFASFLLTLIAPVAHLAICVVTQRGLFEHGWLALAVLDLPASLLLFGAAFQDDRFMFWFGLFGTLWWFLIGLGIWLLRRLSPRIRPPWRSKPAG